REIVADDDRDLVVEPHGCLRSGSLHGRRTSPASCMLVQRADGIPTMVRRDWFHVTHDAALGIEGLRAQLDTYAYGRHAHDTWAIGVCEAGSQTFTCRGARQRTRPGSVILFEPFDLHDGYATTGDGVVYRMLY